MCIRDSIHVDEPLIDEAKDQVGATAPADRIPMSVLLRSVEHTCILEMALDLDGDVVHIFITEPVETVNIHAELIDRGNHRKVVFLREREVFLTGSRRDVHDASAFGRADIVPWNHTMRDPGIGGQVVEGTAICPANELRSCDL